MELERGIIIATWKVAYIDMETAQKAVKSRLVVFNGEKYPCLININSIKETTKEARDFLASEKGCEGFTAGAFLVDSILENVMASMYIYLNKPVVPTKVFKDRTKAVEWLAGFVEKNNPQ